MIPFRRPLRAFYLETLRRIVHPRSAITSLGPALVFAPHQDDETLGCGGTIIKKRRAGERVSIVYMTDGSRSNNVVGRAELKTMRSQEAIAGAKILGVDPEQIRFLEFPDGELAAHGPEARVAVREILETEKALEIFIPCPNDKHVDHIATNDIVWSAAKGLKTNVMVYEYPVHFWGHWPLIDDTRNTPARQQLSALRLGLRSFLYALAQFNCATLVGDVLDVKRAALAQHRSQMTRLVPDTAWKILPDVADGEWLELLFQDYELFHRRRYRGLRSA